MADEPQAPTTPQSNGAASPNPEPAARPTLREVAEASWDQVQEAADNEPGEQASPDATGQDGRTRDSLGRFAPADQAAKPGEQSTDPAPKPDPASGVTKPVDPALGSNQPPPQHWSEQDRKTFATLPPAGQEFLLRRLMNRLDKMAGREIAWAASHRQIRRRSRVSSPRTQPRNQQFPRPV